MNVVREHWDRILIYVFLMAYGGYSLTYPIVSFERAAPYWAELMLGTEFVLAGVFLCIGLWKPQYRMLGLLIVAIGLFTISGAVAVVGGARVLAYAFLFGAFALQSVADIRAEKTERERRRDEKNQLLEELVQLAEESRQGER